MPAWLPGLCHLIVLAFAVVGADETGYFIGIAGGYAVPRRVDYPDNVGLESMCGSREEGVEFAEVRVVAP